ncbi:hypothetical protein QYF50_02300 [Paenibacillus vini]|nr:hypothetical protein [Paenibacillus vini]MDN4066712.1 hypothetical protein [Paenibacillus vini]
MKEKKGSLSTESLKLAIQWAQENDLKLLPALLLSLSGLRSSEILKCLKI